MVDREAIRQRWSSFGSKLDERGRRLFAAAEVKAAGRGGMAAVSEITGIARSTIQRGLLDLDAPALAGSRVRREGGGRREIADNDPTLINDLRTLAEPATMGDPMRALTWVSKSPAKLADALKDRGHDVCRNTVDKLLATKLEYSRQFNRKTHEGASHPDRNAQFEHINAKVVVALAKGEPVISVDTKKKELVGSRCTISRTKPSVRSSPTASTTSAPTPAGSASASRAIRRSSRCSRSVPGSSASAASAIPTWAN